MLPDSADLSQILTTHSFIHPTQAEHLRCSHITEDPRCPAVTHTVPALIEKVVCERDRRSIVKENLGKLPELAGGTHITLSGFLGEVTRKLLHRETGEQG
jgi:hypothetical protein